MPHNPHSTAPRLHWPRRWLPVVCGPWTLAWLLSAPSWSAEDLGGEGVSPRATAEILQQYGKRQARLHDPSSLVRCGETYWLFSTGRFVSSWSSSDLMEWQRGPAVFSELPAWVRAIVPEQRGHFWAPDIIHLGDRYLLYYSVSSFGKNTSAIALATATTLDPNAADYGWQDQGIVIQTDATDRFNAIDPAVIETAAGELWMAFGSFWSGLQLLALDPATGMPADPAAEPIPLAWNESIEAAHLHERDGWFYLFLNHGTCCQGVESTYEIRVGRSRTINGPYLDQAGRDLRRRGGTLLLASDGPFIGPGHANVSTLEDGDLLHCHYYDASERGRSFLAMMPLTWSSDGWPSVVLTDNGLPAPR